MQITYISLILILLAIIAGLLVVIYRLWRQTRRESLGLDETVEDALKDLYHLSREQPTVRPSDLIRTADLQPGRFPLIQAELERRAWVEMDQGRLKILPAGEKRAIQLIRAHRLWERYLAEKEGLALDALHAEAMRREHLITPEEADQLDAQLGYPGYDSHVT